MSSKELSRYRVLGGVMEGQLALHEAAAALAISPRHARRLLKRLRESGAEALVHGNRGRVSANRTPAALRDQILVWVEGLYAGFNDTHLTEMLAEREQILIGRETLRGILRAAGHRPKRRRRPKRHHLGASAAPARDSWSCGMVLPTVGSARIILPFTLMAAVDDADSELLAAFFTPQETSEAYLRLLQALVQKHGIPASIYQDRHSALRRNDDSWSLEEQLVGRQRPTQVGQVLEDLAIHPVFALSPQAKGRVERLFGVLQDRLLVEMRLDDITTPEAANRYLNEGWIGRFNRRFRTTPRS